MKFEEFKAAMKERNELIKASYRKNIDRRALIAALKENNAVLNEFLLLNPEVFKVEIDLLTNKLNNFIKDAKKKVNMIFKTIGNGESANFVMMTVEPHPKDGRRQIRHTYKLCKIAIDEQKRLCADLSSFLEPSYMNFNRNMLYGIRGFEDCLWEVIEENFNNQVTTRISLLETARQRIAARQAEVQQPDFVKRELTKLNEEDKHAAEEIKALSGQLD